MPPRPMPDWRDGADYDWLIEQDRSGWAWEWLRRNPRYREQALAAMTETIDGASVADAASWGLHRFENPDLDARIAMPMWAASAWPQVLKVEARGTADAGGFNILALGTASVMTGAGGTEHWLDSGGGRSLRLDVVGGTLKGGAVRLWLELRGPNEIKAMIKALRQLADRWRGRSLPPGDMLSPARTGRFIRLLRAADALAAGASQRSIAAVLFDPKVASGSWRLEQASVRLQAQRVVRNARAMMTSGHQKILAGKP